MLRDERGLHQRQAGVAEQLRIALEAAARLPMLETTLATIHRRLETEAYAEEERRASDAFLQQIRDLGYTRVEHEARRAELQSYQQWPEEQQKLQHALQDLDNDRRSLERSRELCAIRTKEVVGERQELATFDEQLRGRQTVELNLADSERKLRESRDQEALARESMGRAKADVETCDRVAEYLVGYRAQHAALAEQRGIYEELAQAFGKKGIQAMLIETAIPELEHEANDLLARMTDNQMHLALETQRDNKKGDTVETLDIRIADGLGTRDYGMFSGGEAFRVNFAMRVALSKLLARRANAHLKTLIIDEGFGTQDGNGRDRIVEAINAVSTDFERILVITHIAELRDLFPHQIEVTKGVDGSSWRLA
jgi:exonuclease SbcC